MSGLAPGLSGRGAAPYDVLVLVGAGRLIPVLALALLVGTFVGGARAGDEPNPVIGATYEFSAAAGAATAAGKGQLDLDSKFEASVRASNRQGGMVLTIVGRVAKFRLDFLLPRKKLALTIEVTKGPAQCPKGSRGTVTLVDDETGDSVRVRFSRTGCSLFERSWLSGGFAQRARVQIAVLQGE